MPDRQPLIRAFAMPNDHNSNPFVSKLLWVIRGVLACLALYMSVLFTAALKGGMMWGPEISPVFPGLGALLYATTSLTALGYVFFGSKDWLRWLMLIVPLMPIVL